MEINPPCTITSSISFWCKTVTTVVIWAVIDTVECTEECTVDCTVDSLMFFRSIFLITQKKCY